ncbi:signal peptidase I [Zhihengliuella halotolerans]|uniref:Signal peptidase I n=1 Tax=Zhihengliuella halotolerans TaxID=370736 RepID=A0A4Q8ABB4_9MICC|nr:signal peptidase I [Zhihengliuella halotolerans]RZU60855.1 signal peptidase [Zhihengliuella halotolerans]
MVRRAAARPRASRAARFLGGALLNVAAAGGAVCIVLAVCAFVFDVSLLMFKTGSMEPTIPTGSVAVARAVPAADVQVGQIVTVDRPGQLPVTHRITSIETADAGSATRTFTMRGDANRDDDPYPYTVEEVRRVFFHVPHAANVVVWFGNPYVLGGLTLGASALVTWAFWPRGHRRDEPADARRGGRHRGAAVLALIVAAAGAQAAFPAPAAAAPEESTASGDVLRVSTRGDAAAMGDLRPGASVPWQVGVWADAEESGNVSARLSVRGDPRLALDVAVRFCTGRWTGYDDAGRSMDEATCTGRDLGAVDLGTVAVGDSAELFTRVPADEARWMLFDVRIAGGTGPQAQRAQGASTALRVTASGFGEDVGVEPPPGPSPTPSADPTSPADPPASPTAAPTPRPTSTPSPGPGDLPDTGARIGIAWLGGAALVLGSVLLEARRRARRNRGESDAG